MIVWYKNQDSRELTDIKSVGAQIRCDAIKEGRDMYWLYLDGQLVASLQKNDHLIRD